MGKPDASQLTGSAADGCDVAGGSGVEGRGGSFGHHFQGIRHGNIPEEKFRRRSDKYSFPKFLLGFMLFSLLLLFVVSFFG